jgi:hypothetical protein
MATVGTINVMCDKFSRKQYKEDQILRAASWAVAPRPEIGPKDAIGTYTPAPIIVAARSEV